uniref:CoA transferase n=1 Tax=Pararhizobium sp. IMCC3301 TaxID=3067904 RepID=UPI0027427D08|nr:CoA transferase [Pararhizobium sp. IMCC3301]
MNTPFLKEIVLAFPGTEAWLDTELLSVRESDPLAAWFAVSDLAAASVGMAGLMVAGLTGTRGAVRVDRFLASLWFGMTLRPLGWDLPPVWDPIAGDYQTSDGWIRLHTNAPHHRRAALSVLGEVENRTALAPLVAEWNAEELEAAVVAADGCAATMRSIEAWANHRQGQAVATESLVHWQQSGESVPKPAPLAGLKVLDLTRVLAGPVATRFLAGYGARVLRLDPPFWEEGAVVPEVTLGKHCAGLDLGSATDRAVFDALVKSADVLVHGYRPGALEGLGYESERLRTLNPGLIDVSLNAYGWTGPWAGRRGFDSLVQMSSGIAEYGMAQSGAEKPVPLPVQALDHATGYLMAASVLYALQARNTTGRVLSARLSLARTAHLLAQSKRTEPGAPARGEADSDLADAVEHTGWGLARRVRFPLSIDRLPVAWRIPAGQLRRSPPQWG